MRTAFLYALAVVTLAGAACAQTTGRISGFVKDPAGSSIPSVNITARMTEQQSTTKASTNTEGFYDFVALPPGNYDRILDFSRAVTGALFFVPSATFLENVATGDPAPPAVEPRPEQARPRAAPGDGSLGIGSLKDGT